MVPAGESLDAYRMLPAGFEELGCEPSRWVLPLVLTVDIQIL